MFAQRCRISNSNAYIEYTYTRFNEFPKKCLSWKYGDDVYNSIVMADGKVLAGNTSGLNNIVLITAKAGTSNVL